MKSRRGQAIRMVIAGIILRSLLDSQGRIDLLCLWFSKEPLNVVVHRSMHSSIFYGFLIFGTLAMAIGCQHPSGSLNHSSSSLWASGTPEVRDLDQLNRRLTQAYEREDIATLRRLLADAHIHNNVFGSRLSKDEFLKDIESGVLEFISYETPSIEWHRDGDIAIATGVIEAVAKRSGKVVPSSRFRFTRIFKREGSGWKVLLFHNTMAP